ncbi:MAG TPA: glycosyltransferase family 39 protein, partial [Anaerolinea sp.]|nr:glycosyltransferase family 39 protein [Anaerolinea sp.]
MIETAAGWIESKKAGWKVSALLLLAAAIRLIVIQTLGFRYDDVFSIFLAQRSLGNIVQGTAADTMPPLYYFLLHFWLLVSAQPAWIRLLSVIFSVLAVFLTYQLVKRLFGQTVGFGAAFVMAISPFQFYHAQDVRNYALLLCCQLGYMLSWVVIWQHEEARERTSWRSWAGLVICGGLAMYTHNAAVFGLI